MQANKILNQRDPPQIFPAHIRADHLGIISNYRTVKMMVSQLFIQIVGHAGVENSIHPAFQQKLDMPVHQLGRETNGI